MGGLPEIGKGSTRLAGNGLKAKKPVKVQYIHNCNGFRLPCTIVFVQGFRIGAFSEHLSRDHCPLLLDVAVQQPPQPAEAWPRVRQVVHRPVGPANVAKYWEALPEYQ
jgi:hypothetical protein